MEQDIPVVAKKLARNAGVLLKKYYCKKNTLTYKIDTSLVTEADLAADRYLRTEIEKFFPSHSIMSEESPEKKTSSDYQWIIDPLDGTTNFSICNPFFGVSICVLFEGTAQVGVIYSPIQDELFWSIKGKGAFLNNRPIIVDNQKDIEKSVITFCNGRDIDSRKILIQIYQNLKLRNNRIRQIGSAALELSYVAAARTGGFFMPGVNSWDILAGSLIVEEAKGKVTDFYGKKFTIRSQNLIAAPESVHQALLELIQQMNF